MTLTFPPEVQSNLKAVAEESGLTPEQYVSRLIANAVAGEQTGPRPTEVAMSKHKNLLEAASFMKEFPDFLPSSIMFTLEIVELP